MGGWTSSQTINCEGGIWKERDGGRASIGGFANLQHGLSPDEVRADEDLLESDIRANQFI